MGISIECIKRYLFIALVFGEVNVSAQLNPEEEFRSFKSTYPDEAAVYVIKKETVTYSIENDSVKTTVVVYEELLHLGENTVRYAGDKIYSSGFYQISDIEAYTLVPGKRKYERIDVTEFKESFDRDSYVFYDDSKEISFTYPGVQKGVKTILTYKKTIKDPRMMGMFFFNTYIPVHEASYLVKYDPEIKIVPQYFNMENVKIETKEKKLDDGSHTFTFKASSIDKIKFDMDCPSYNYLAATVYCPVFSFKKSDGSETLLLSTPAQLHQWYRTFLDKVQAPSDEVKELVTTIINPDDTDLEKVRKIYYWVQANIKYIAFEDGMRGLIPHPGEYVISKRYGDCKDMASSIVSMLREIGIDAHYTWIGSRDLPYKYSETPSPITDNHMIATFILDGKTYFLDATGQYTPLDYPTSMIQGKECLISLGPDDFKIETVPVIPKEMNLMSDSVKLTLDDGTINGTGHVTLTGYAKVFNTYKLIKSSQKNVDNYVERLLGKGSNKFEIGDFTVYNVDDLSKPINLDYSFYISDYYRKVGDDIYINLILDKTMTDALLENRTVPIENDYKYINRNVSQLSIPEGYTVSSLPANEQKENENFGYNIQYEVSETEVIAIKEFYVDYLLMQPDQFDSWNAIIADYAKACRKALIISKKPN
ncbi:MAG: hypothetical protein ACJA08_000449 [Cyclobacteriaceae bacterium]|jgi:hypothetical protein